MFTLRLVLALSAAGLTVPMASAAGRHPALPTPQFLVYLARDHGLNRSGKQTPADVLHIQTLLRAAVRLNPQLPDAYVWLYELATLNGQPEQAADYLEALTRHDPGNVGAFRSWLQIGPASIQTLEQRRTWLRTLLDAPHAPETQSLIHTELALLAAQQLDRGGAREHLAVAERLCPACPDAPQAAVHLLDSSDPPQARLRVLLRAFQTNPLDVTLTCRVAALLDGLGFAAEALPFYEHAVSLLQGAAPGAPLPGGLLLDLAHNAAARGDWETSLTYTRLARRDASGPHYEAAFFQLWLLGHMARNAEAESLKESLATDFADIKQPQDAPIERLAQAAWFYTFFDPQPQRALLLAQSAAQRAANDPFVMRVLGWALSLSDKPDEARRVLEPLADSDPYAAVLLAQILKKSGETDAAEQVLADLEPVPTVGFARDLLAERGLPPTASRSAHERHPQIPVVLAELDRRVMDFHRRPDRYLQAEIALEDFSPAPGEPWWAVLSLANVGPFPITLGPDQMVNPVLLLSIDSQGDREREFPAVLTISMDEHRVLRPEQSIALRRVIDLGPVRRMNRRTPQHLQRITVSTILDPVRGSDGRWRPGLTGQALRPITFNRLPSRTTSEAWHALFAALSGSSEALRFRALEGMAELLGEHQNHQLQRLDYEPAPIPSDRIQAALLSALNSESWEIRARTLDALQVAGLDRTLLDAVRQQLEHDHWLVRLMAVRLLGQRARERFAGTLESIAQQDEDELVRDLARSYMLSMPPATTPVSQPVVGDANE